MANLALVFTTFLFLQGCSVYKSEGRKQFESEYPARMAASSFLSQLSSCTYTSQMNNETLYTLSSNNFLRIFSNGITEAWQGQEEKPLQIITVQSTPLSSQTCIYHFEDMNTWIDNKRLFLQELDYKSEFRE